MAEDNGFAMGYALGQDSNGGGNNNGGGFGGSFGEGLWAVIILAILFGRGGFGGFGGFGGGMGGSGGGNCCCNSGCATQADLAAGFNNSAVLGNLNDLALGQAGIQQTLCQGFNGVNTTVLQGFNGVDNAICTLGYQNQAGFNALGAQLAACCCDIERGIDRGVTQGVMNTNAIQQQIAACCCDLEKTNLQNRFDAQVYNSNTLLAIDKLGDRIIDYMTQDKIATLTAENQNLKFAASQASQNAFITANQEAQTAELIRRLGRDFPVPAYVVPNPNCCYGNPVGIGYGNQGCGCGCGCG